MGLKVNLSDRLDSLVETLYNISAGKHFPASAGVTGQD